jgi:hypothetical protein
MTGNQDTSFTIDTHHHILPDFFWQATENAHARVGGLAPLRWSKEATISFMDDAGIDVAVVSLSTPGVHTGDSAKAWALARRCTRGPCRRLWGSFRQRASGWTRRAVMSSVS